MLLEILISVIDRLDMIHSEQFGKFPKSHIWRYSHAIALQHDEPACLCLIYCFIRCATITQISYHLGGICTFWSIMYCVCFVIVVLIIEMPWRGAYENGAIGCKLFSNLPDYGVILFDCNFDRLHPSIIVITKSLWVLQWSTCTEGLSYRTQPSLSQQFRLSQIETQF